MLTYTLRIAASRLFLLYFRFLNFLCQQDQEEEGKIVCQYLSDLSHRRVSAGQASVPRTPYSSLYRGVTPPSIVTIDTQVTPSIPIIKFTIPFPCHVSGFWRTKRYC